MKEIQNMRCLLLLFLAFLTGCASIPNTSVANLKGGLPDGHGIVVAQTLTNGIRITGPLTRWDEMILWRVDGDEGEKTLSLPALPGGAHTEQYMGAVPSGKYRVGLLWAYLTSGDFSYWAKAFVPPAIGEFEVTAGQVTDLGLILYQPFETKSLRSNELPDYAITQIVEPSVWPSVRNAQADILTELGSNPIITALDNTETREARIEVYEKMESLGQPLSLHRAGNETVVVGKLGLVESLTSQAKLSLGKFTVLDVLKTESDGWLVGGEQGLLVEVSSTGEERFRLDLDLNEHVSKLTPINSSTALITTLHEGVFIFYLFDFHSRALNKIKSIQQLKPGFFFTVSYPEILSKENKIDIFMDGIKHSYSLEDASWSQEKSKEFTYLNVQPNGTIIGAPYSGWSGYNKTVFSTDSGQNWTELKTNTSTYKTYRFANANLLRTGGDADFKLFGKGWVDKEFVPVLLSKDNGATWTNHGKLPIECKQLFPEVSEDNSLIVLCEDGSVVESKDMGASWTNIREANAGSVTDFPKGFTVTYQRSK
jgi:photosystem II stability/assembly factor-like uncharacterized protein